MSIRWIDQFDVIMLDLDGLIVNTEELHFRAYKKILELKGIPFDWSFSSFCSIAHRAQNSLQHEIYFQYPELKVSDPEWPLFYREKQEIYMNLLRTSEIQCLPGVDRLISAITEKKTCCCVVTNSSQEEVFLIKNSVPKLKSIPFWVTREQYTSPKPNPDAYQKAIKIVVNNPRAKIIGFEDSVRGLNALKNSGLNHVLVCPKSHLIGNEKILESTVHFESFDQIPDTVDLSQLLKEKSTI